MKFYNAYISSRPWTLTNKRYKQIETVHIQFLRRIVRGCMVRMSSKKEIEEEKDADNLCDGKHQLGVQTYK